MKDDTAKNCDTDSYTKSGENFIFFSSFSLSSLSSSKKLFNVKKMRSNQEIVRKKRRPSLRDLKKKKNKKDMKINEK
jgi:hypothetical protein